MTLTRKQIKLRGTDDLPSLQSLQNLGLRSQYRWVRRLVSILSRQYSKELRLTLNSHASNPACVTVSNALFDQYIMYCGQTATVITTSYTNLVSTGSTATAPMTVPSSTAGPTVDGPTTARTTASSASLSSGSHKPDASSSSSSSPPSRVSSSSPHATGHIHGGAIAGIATGSLLIIIGLLAALFFCIQNPRKEHERRMSRTPRGTLGGAVLPGARSITSDKDEDRDEDKDEDAHEPQEETAMLKDSKPLPAIPIPWGPDSITSAPRTSRELDSQPFLPSQRPGEASELPRLGSTVSQPTRRYALESELSISELHDHVQVQAPLSPDPESSSSSHCLSPQSSPSAPLLKSSSQQSLSAKAPMNPARFSRNTELSEPISESSWLDPNQRLSPVSSLSRAGSRAASGMSATGNWKGYMSPETALAGGWNNEGEDDTDGGAGRHSGR